MLIAYQATRASGAGHTVHLHSRIYALGIGYDHTSASKGPGLCNQPEFELCR